MRVSFDSVNRYEAPIFHLCDPGCKYENGLLTKAIGIIPSTSDEELVLNFNAKSELNLRVYKIQFENTEENEFFSSLYNKIANRRSIFVDGYGFFTIADVKDGYDEYRTYKDVTAYSCEQEIEDKKVPYIDGTYPLMTQGQTKGLLELLVERLPLWQIGSVDPSVASMYRTFEDVNFDSNVLSFMLEDMQEAYECIILFETTHRIINVYDQNSYLVSTDIHITKDDLIDACTVEENSDDLYTALSVLGDDDLSINAVNPLGTSVIYRFDYYLDWMSPELSTKVETWQNLIESSSPQYYEYATQYYEQMAYASTANHEIDRINIVLDMYKRCRENIVAESNNSQVASYNSIISANGGTTIPTNVSDIDELKALIDGLIEDAESDLAEATSDYNSATASAASINASMQTIRDSVDIATYFTPEEYDELANYIIEGQYSDDYITVTESMSQTERLAQMKTLYDRAVSTLEKAAYPTQKYTIDVENFLFQKDFQHFSEQLETGCLVNADIDDGDVAALFLSTIQVNWDDKSLSLTFGNRYNRFDPKALYNNVLGSVQKSANSIEYIKNLITPIANGELAAMQTAIANSRNLAKNEALSATNNVIIIDDTGYTGRKILIDGESFDPRQIKIVNNQIVFTRDGWETASTAIGEIVIRNSDGTYTTAYGINAETLIGDLILGSQLQIGYSDSSGNTHDITSGILESLSTQYYESTSANETTGGTWTSTLPSARQPNTFLWIRNVYTYADGSIEYGEAVCTEGVPGADGGKGDKGDKGDTGTGYVSEAILYYLKDSNTAAPNKPTSPVTSTSTSAGTWTTKEPSWRTGYYYWTCHQFEKTDGTYTWTDVILDSALSSANETAAAAQTAAAAAQATADSKSQITYGTASPMNGSTPVWTGNAGDIYIQKSTSGTGGDVTWLWNGDTGKWVQNTTGSTTIVPGSISTTSLDVDNINASGSFTLNALTNNAQQAILNTNAVSASKDYTDTALDSYSTTTEMQSAITQSANSITTSVSQTYETKSDASSKLNTAKDYTDTALGSYSTTTEMQSAISQSASEIRTSVSETYETKNDASSKLTTAKSYTDSAIDSIEIGGRNLFIAATRSNDTYITNAGATAGWARTVLSDYIVVSAGDSIIAQFWKPENTAATGDDRGCLIIAYWNSSKAFISRTYQYFTSDYLSYQFEVPINAAYIRVTYHFGIDGPRGTDWDPYGTFQVKVEKGNMPTDWSIAPEDIDSELTTMQSSITQNANNIALKVSQTDYNGATIASLINQSADTVQIEAEHINLTGQVTITDLDSSVQTSISNGSSAYSRATALRGTCSTAATTAAKVVTCAGFALTQGATVTVYFSTANTKADAALTLNVNSTGAKTIYVASAATSSSNQLLWVAGSSLTFVYDGTYWRVLDSPGTWDGTACSVAAGTAAKTTTASGVVIFKGTTISVPMTYENTNTSATLNVSSLGAKNIYYGTTTTRPTTSNGRGWIAGRTVDFRFDGAYWRLKDTGTVIDGSHITTGTIDVDRVNLYGDMTVNQTKGGAVGGTLGYMSGLTIDDNNTAITTHGMGLKSSDEDHYIIVTTDGIRLTEKVSDTQAYDAYLSNGWFVVRAGFQANSTANFKNYAYFTNTPMDSEGRIIVPRRFYTFGSPSSNFAAQTITISQSSVDLSKMNFFLFVCAFTTASAQRITLPHYCPDSQSTAYLHYTGLYGSVASVTSRTVTVDKTNQSFTFSDATLSQGSSGATMTANNRLIPLYILGCYIAP